MGIADLWIFFHESANPFINLCSKSDNSIKLQQKKYTIDLVQKIRKYQTCNLDCY